MKKARWLGTCASILHFSFFILHLHGGCGSTAEYGRAKAEVTVQLRPPAPFSGDVAHQQSARLTCERRRGQRSSSPPFRSSNRRRHFGPYIPGQRKAPCVLSTNSNFRFRSMFPNVWFRVLWHATSLSSVLVP